MRLAASLRYSLYAAASVLFASGVVRDSPWLRVHGAAAMIVLLLIGAVTALHSGSAWRDRKNRISGALLGGVLALLAVSGYLLYYSGSDATRQTASLAHWLLGLALPVFLAGHVWLGRRASGKA